MLPSHTIPLIIINNTTTAETPRAINPCVNHNVSQIPKVVKNGTPNIAFLVRTR